MKRWRKRLLLFPVLLLALLAAGVFVVLRDLPQIVAKKLSAELNGAEVTISDARLTSAGLELEKISVMADGARVIGVKRMVLGGSWLELYRGEIRSMQMERLRIVVGNDEQGRWNLQRFAASGNGTSGKSMKVAVSVTDGAVAFSKNPWGIGETPIHFRVTGDLVKTADRLEGKLGSAAVSTANLSLLLDGRKVELRKPEVKVADGKTLTFSLGKEVTTFSLPLQASCEKAAVGSSEWSTVAADIEATETSARIAARGAWKDQAVSAEIKVSPSVAPREVEAALKNLPVRLLQPWWAAADTEGRLDLTGKIQLAPSEQGTQLRGVVTLVSADELKFVDASLQLNAPKLSATFLLLLPKEKSEEHILESLVVTDSTAEMALFKYGANVEAREAGARLSLAQGKIAAQITGAVRPTGNLTLEVSGPVWPKLELVLQGTLREMDLAKIAATYMRPPLEMTADGRAALSLTATATQDWQAEEPMDWQAKGQLDIGPATAALVEQKITAGGLEARLPFALTRHAKFLTIPSAAQIRVAKLSQADAEIGRAILLDGFSGTLGLNSKTWLRHTRLDANFSAEHLVGSNVVIADGRADKLVFEKGALQAESLRAARVAYGEDLEIKELALTKLQTNWAKEEVFFEHAEWRSLLLAQADATAQTVRYGEILLEQASAKLALADGALQAREIRATGREAALDGSVAVNMTGEPVVELRATVKNLNPSDWTPQETRAQFDLDGRLAGEVRLKLHGLDWEDLHVDDFNLQMGNAGRGKIRFGESPYLRALKSQQPQTMELVLEGGNQITYESARIAMTRSEGQFSGEFVFRGPKIALTFKLSPTRMSWEKLKQHIINFSKTQRKGKT